MNARRIRVARVYDEPSNDDGTRVLVDRIWPRGVAKERAGWDTWCQDVAPSAELRMWYGHDAERFAEFRRRYRRELEAAPARDALRGLRRDADRGPLTLLTASKDMEHSQAAVLAELLADGG